MFKEFLGVILVLKKIKVDKSNGELIQIYARGRENILLRYYEPDLGFFIAESPKVIERAIDAGFKVSSILVTEQQYNLETKDGEILQRIFSKIEEQEKVAFEAYQKSDETLEKSGLYPSYDKAISGIEVPLFISDEKTVKDVTDFSMTRGAMAVMCRRAFPEVSEVLSMCGQSELSEYTRIAVLDGVVNPTNIGAIFRSAAALHIDAVLLTPNCADALYRRAIRVSMGNVFLVPWTVTSDNDSWVSELKSLGFSIAALALDDDSISIDDPILKREKKLALVLGNEGDGLLLSTIKSCDHTVMIPMTPGVDSLNVAAASAVAFWATR